MLPAVNRSMRRWPQGRGAGTLFRAKNLLMQRPNGQPALASGAEDWCPCPVAAHPAGGVGTTREYMSITTTAVVLYDNTSPLVPESTGEAGGFGHLPVTLSLQVVIQARADRVNSVKLKGRGPLVRDEAQEQGVAAPFHRRASADVDARLQDRIGARVYCAEARRRRAAIARPLFRSDRALHASHGNGGPSLRH